MSVRSVSHALKSVGTLVAGTIVLTLLPAVLPDAEHVLPAADATGDSYADVIDAANPDGWWRAGESSGTTGTDASGNGHTMTYSSITLGRPGAIAGDTDTAAKQQPGASATASMGTYTASSVSVEAWTRTTTLLTNDVPIVVLGPGNSSVDLELAVAHTTGAAVFSVRIGGTMQRAVGTYRVSDGAWHHLVGTYDGSAVRIYVDGVQNGSVTVSGSRASGTSRTLLVGNGSWCGGPGCSVNGDFDEVALYGRALSSTEVADHDTAGGTHAVGCTATDAYSKIICKQQPVGYWRLGNSSTSTSATDQTSLANHGAYRLNGSGPVMGATGSQPANTNTAMTTNGQNQAMETPYDPYGHFATPKASMEGWLKVSSMNSWTNQDAFSVGGTGERFGITVSAMTHAIGAHVLVGSTTYTMTGAVIPFGTWLHTALTYDGTTAKLYLNGQLTASVSASGRLAPCVGCKGSIGAPYNCGGDCAPLGTFDEVAYYDKALTAAELAVRPFGAAPTWPGELRGGGNPALDYQPCVCADPVMPATGALVESFTDFAIDGRGPGLAFARSYDSTDASTAGVLGYGWRHNYQMKVATDPNLANAKAVTQENGSVVPFASDGGGGYVAAGRAQATLTQNGNGTWTFVRRNREIFDFDSSGNLTAITDLNGYSTTLTYSSGKLTTVTDSASRTLTLHYDTSNRIDSVTDPAGRVVEFAYNAAGNLVTATDPAGEDWQFGYDTAHRITTMTDPRTGVLTNTYDTNGRVDSQEDAEERVTDFAYTASTTTITDARGAVTVQEYDQYLLMSQTNADGTADETTSAYTYDVDTLDVVTKTDGLNHTWSYTYDDDGNRLTATNPENETESWTYNVLGQVLTHTDGEGVTTTNTFDTAGNLLTTSTPLVGTSYDAETTFVYGDTNHPGDLTSFVDARGKTSYRTYDTYGQLTSETDPNGDVTTSSYACATGCFDDIGWLYSVVAPRGNESGADPADFTTTYTRDELGRVLTVTDPEGGVTTSVYDAMGNRTSVTDPHDLETMYAYDLVGQLTTTTRADSTTLVTTYDDAGNVTGQTDGANKTTTSTFDLLQRRTSVTDPENRTTEFTYDDANRVVTMEDPDANVVTLGYDTANRLTSRAYSDSGTPDVTFTYDDNGRRLTMTDGTGTTTYEYDSLGRLTDREDGAAHEVHYDYDLSGLVTAITYPNALTVNREYDDAGRFTSVTDWNSAETAFGYNEDGELTSVTYPNGVVETVTRDQADRIVGVENEVASTTLAAFAYTRSIGGVLDTLDATGATGQTDESYDYDSIVQLTGYTTPTTTFSFDYDAADNPTLVSGVTQTFDDANQLATSTANGGTTFTYNSRGARTSATTTSSTTTYGYDQANRLTSFSGTQSATYAYDGDGLRASKTIGSNTASFAWDTVGAWPLLLSDGTTNYVYGPGGLPIAQLGQQQTVSLVATGTGSDTTGTATSVGVTFSATAQRNDQILLAVNQSQGQNAQAPSGYTTVGTYAAPNAGEVTVVFRKTAAGGETGATVTFNQGVNVHAKSVIALVYRGIDPVDPIEATSSAGTNPGATSVAAPAVSPAASGMLVMISHELNNVLSATWTAPTGMTKRAEVVATSVASAVHDQPITSSGSTGTRTATTSFAGQLEGVLIALRQAPSTYYLHHDQQGSTRLVTNPAGHVAGTYVYDPFGRTTSHTGPIDCALQFAGEYTDAESALIYLRARYYDPATAQFLTRDLLALVTRSPYGYAANDPLNGSDPTGLICFNPKCVIGGAAGVAGGVIHRMPVGQVLDAVSEATGLTVGGCVGGAANVPGFEVNVTLCYVSTPSGETGLTLTGGAGMNFSAVPGANGFVGPTVSNAQTLDDLGGEFAYVSGSASAGPYGAGGSYSWGENKCGDTIWQASAGWAPGADMSGGVGTSNTWTAASYW